MTRPTLWSWCRAALHPQRRGQQKPNHPGAAAAQKLLDDKLAAFQLGDRDHDKKWPVEEYRAYRLQLAEAIEQMSK